MATGGVLKNGFSAGASKRLPTLGGEGSYCHNASLWRFTRCQVRSSSNRLCCEPDRGEGECEPDAEAEPEADADDGLSLPRLSDSDLLEPEKETLEGNRSASFGLSVDMIVFQQLNGLARVDSDDCKDKKKKKRRAATLVMQEMLSSEPTLTRGNDRLRKAVRSTEDIELMH